MKIHWYYKFLIVFLIFFSMFFLFNKNISYFVNNSSLKSYINSLLVSISSSDNNKEDSLINNTLLEENNNLKEEIAKLKELMKLKSTYTGYKMIYSKTIIRNKMYWYNTIVIDKGSSDGVKEGNAVIGLNGLIGIISNTTKDSSTVKLITNNDTNYRISGAVKKEKETVVGLIEGYNYPYIKVSLVESLKVELGDKFYSYGLENFPKNIYIGEVKKIKKDNYDLSTILYIEPKQDMNDINYVVVLNNK